MFTTQLILCSTWLSCWWITPLPLSISYPWKSKFHSRVGSTCDEYKIDLRWTISTSDNQDNNDIYICWLCWRWWCWIGWSWWICRRRWWCWPGAVALHQAMAGNDIVEEQTQTITATVISLHGVWFRKWPTNNHCYDHYNINCLIFLLALREGQRICLPTGSHKWHKRKVIRKTVTY